LEAHRDQFLLMRDGEIVEYFDKLGDASRSMSRSWASRLIHAAQKSADFVAS
jgi:hypothetical protein